MVHQRKLSNYEFFKRIDKKLERMEIGDLKDKVPLSQKKMRQCELCRQFTATEYLIKSQVMGTHHAKSHFKFRYLVGCADCFQQMQAQRPPETTDSSYRDDPFLSSHNVFLTGSSPPPAEEESHTDESDKDNVYLTLPNGNRILIGKRQ